MMRVLSYQPGWLACIAVAVLVAPGCTRKFYRKKADDDVVGLLTEKNRSPDWAIEHWHVYPDPRARFADPLNPDRPPKPPDDPAAWFLTPDPQPRGPKKTGKYEGTEYLAYLEGWDAENRARRASRPAAMRAQSPAYGNEAESTSSDSYRKALESNEKRYLITLEQASELALFNSREFQDRREDLYAAALPVSLERFSFAAQFFATEQAVREVAGRQTSNPGNRWRLNSTAGANKLFPTGATLLAQLANRLVIDFGHNGSVVGLSTLTLQMTQPLLQGGGWAVTMEALTQAERNLLYAVRSYARFRKIYYTFLAGGYDNIFNSPYSLAGLTLRGIGPTLTASGQGYYPTLLLAALQGTEIQNIAGLERYWRVFQAYEEGGDVSRLQVDQVEQQLLRGRTSLLQRRQDLQNGLDQFKIQLGLPTPLPLELDDSPLRPVNDHLDRFNQARDEFDAVRRAVGEYVDVLRRPAILLGGGLLARVPIDVPLRARFRALFQDSPAVRGTTFRTTIIPRLGRWERLDDKAITAELAKLADERRDLLERRARLEVANQKIPESLDRRVTDLRAEINLGRFEQALRLYERKPWQKAETPRQSVREQESAFRTVSDLFALVIGEAREERLAQIREAWPDLPTVTVDGADLLGEDLDKSLTIAAQTALANRLELMNARAALVDAWRQIAVRANSLMGVLDVGYNLSATSPPDVNRPLAVGGSRSTHQMVINGELPLVRRSERNNYRTALIAYQRQRRALQATEDLILNDVRSDLRQLRVLAENYKIQQRAVEVAYAQVENSLEALQAPPDPRSLQGGQTAGNAAALTQQLLNAQSSLLQAQNTLYTVWINYLIARMQFYRDLEILPLDPRGVWTDEYSPDEPPGTVPAGGGRPERLPEPVPVLAPAAAQRDVLRPVGGTDDGPRWQRSRP